MERYRDKRQANDAIAQVNRFEQVLDVLFIDWRLLIFFLPRKKKKKNILDLSLKGRRDRVVLNLSNSAHFFIFLLLIFVSQIPSPITHLKSSSTLIKSCSLILKILNYKFMRFLFQNNLLFFLKIALNIDKKLKRIN